MGKLNLSYKIIPFLYLENVDCLWSVFEVEDPVIDQAEKIIEIMESAVELKVPNKVDYEHGANWGEIK